MVKGVWEPQIMENKMETTGITGVLYWVYIGSILG